MTDDNITKLPVSFKTLGKSGKVFEIKRRSECLHFLEPQSFLVDKDLAYVECGKCSAHLNPMEVLSWLAHNETRWHETGRRYQDEMKRLAERARTKCNYCGKMTRISRR